MRSLDKDFWRFDEVFSDVKLLTLVETPERMDFFSRQMEELFGNRIMNDMTPLDAMGIKPHITCINPRNDVYLDNLCNKDRGWMCRNNELGCAEEHYRLVKTSLLGSNDKHLDGSKGVLIFEDDIRFIKDADLIRRVMENIPDDWDILMFGAFTVSPDIKCSLDEKAVNDYWSEMESLNLWNCSMYALSKEGMKYYVAFQDNHFRVADSPLNHAPSLIEKYNWPMKAYITRFPVVIQEDKDVFVSTVRGLDPNDLDGIDYKNDNTYERGIDKSRYYAVSDFIPEED